MGNGTEWKISKSFRIIITTLTQDTGNFKGSPPLAPLALHSLSHVLWRNRGKEGRRQVHHEDTRLSLDHFIPWMVVYGGIWEAGGATIQYSDSSAKRKAVMFWQPNPLPWLTSLETGWQVEVRDNVREEGGCRVGTGLIETWFLRERQKQNTTKNHVEELEGHQETRRLDQIGTRCNYKTCACVLCSHLQAIPICTLLVLPHTHSGR